MGVIEIGKILNTQAPCEAPKEVIPPQNQCALIKIPAGQAGHFFATPEAKSLNLYQVGGHCYYSRLEAIAVRLEAIASRLEAIPLRLEAINLLVFQTLFYHRSFRVFFPPVAAWWEQLRNPKPSQF